MMSESAAARIRERRTAAEWRRGMGPVVGVSTVLLGGLAVALAHAASAAPPPSRRDTSPGTILPVPAKKPLGAEAAGGGGVASAGGAAWLPPPGQTEMDERIGAAIADLDLADTLALRRFLEVSGSPSIRAVAAEQAKLVGTLFRLRSHAEPRVRAAALALLGVAPQSHFILTEPFLPSFDDPDARVRCEAVVGRVRHGVLDHWRSALPLADDQDPRVRAAAASALGQVAESAAHGTLLRLLDDRCDEVVEAAAAALGRRAMDTPFPVIASLLDSKRPRVRIAGVRLAARYDTPATLSRVLAAADDATVDVRIEALLALASFSGAQADAAGARIQRSACDPAVTRRERIAAFDALAETAAAADLDRVAAAAEQDSDAHVRLAAARTLLARRDPRGCEPLVGLLGDDAGRAAADNEYTRTEAARALRSASGADLVSADRAAWTNLLPALEARVVAVGFSYLPERLSETR